MANLISAIAINGRNFRTYLDVLVADSALIAATNASGGSMNTGVDFRAHKFTVVADSTLPTVVAEGAAKPAVDATVNVGALNVEMFAKFRPVSRQLELTTDPPALAQDIVNAGVPGFPIAYDARHLAAKFGGANKNTDVEYNAAQPVQSISSWLAPYDTTSHGPTAVILNRAGARKLQYAIDTQNRLQAPVQGGLAGITGLPTFLTGCTGLQMGDANILGVVGPFNASYVAMNGGVSVERMPQATINSVGPEQNIVNYRLESAIGYANGVDYDATGRGFTFLIDAI